MTTAARDYITALDVAARAFKSASIAAIDVADKAAVEAEKAFEASGLHSADFPSVQSAEKRYHTARTAFDRARDE